MPSQELASELADLRSKSSAAHTLLKHIYAAHPPSNAEHTLGEEPNASNTKALLKKAISHYHPDRAVQQGWTRRVVILHEEIVKVLTAKYEHFKC
jgi:DnaJ-domain-containing protein 1